MNRRYLFGLVWGLGVLIAAARLRADVSTISEVIRGDTLYDQGDLNGARAAYANSLKLYNKEAAALVGLGNLLYRQNNYSDAINYYDAAIDLYNEGYELDRYNYVAYNNRGMAERALGDRWRAQDRNGGGAAEEYLNRARADFTKAIDINSTYGLPFNLRGEMKRDDGDLFGAQADFHKAVTYEPARTDFLFNLANTEQRMNAFADAAFDYDRLVQKTPQDARAYFYLGVARQAMKDNDGAIAAYTKSIALDPYGANYARFYLALTLRRLYRDESPAGLAQAALFWPKGWPQTVARYLHGELSEKDFLLATGQGNARTVNEQLCSAYYFAGLTHVLNGDSAVARDFFTKALATKAAELNEFDLARGELERLTGKFPPPAEVKNTGRNPK